MKNKLGWGLVLSIIVLFGCLTSAGCGSTQSPATTTTSTTTTTSRAIFTDPAVRLAELSNASFTTKLYYEAIALQPALSQEGTHLHLGFWSLSANRARLAGVLDAINAAASTEVHHAIWDEGVSTATTEQYPSYIIMNKEYWYERINAINHVVTIEGITYYDPYEVTLQNANDIWGTYSQRYTDLAGLFQPLTGRTVEAWCFVQGAKINRVFYTYELPELATLEARGNVAVNFALTYEAGWTNPAQWIIGTTNAPTPEPAN